MNAMKQGHLDAAQAPTVLEAALAYREMGFSVIPVKGKVCFIDWAKYQTKPAPYSVIHEWSARGLLQGVGIVCGKVSQNLAVVDLDGLESVREFESSFNFTTYSVTSGSKEGKHLYFYCAYLSPTTRTKGFELRSNGCYVVAPPSLHPTGNPYTIAVHDDIQRVPHLEFVMQFIRAKIPALNPPHLAAHPNLQPRNEFEAKAREFYFNRAVEGESTRVQQAAEGERNNTLFHATKRLARLLQNGGNEAQLREAMLRAALAVGTPEMEARRTIESGIRHGLMATARAYPDAKKPTKG